MTLILNTLYNTEVKYSNSFDPTKNSPPNEFMSKLKSRMNTFYEKYGGHPMQTDETFEKNLKM